MSNDGICVALVGRLAVPHHAGVAYRASFSAGFDARPAIRDGLRHESAEVRHHCCRFLDHFVTQEVMDTNDTARSLPVTTLHDDGPSKIPER